MNRHHKGKFGKNIITPRDLNSQQLVPREFPASQHSLEEKLENMPISSQPNHQPNHDAANTSESVTAPEHNPMYHVLHPAQEYLIRGIDGLVSIITKPFAYKPIQKAMLITTASLILGGGSAAAYFHIPENPSQENRIIITKPQDYEINGKRLVFHNNQKDIPSSTYNSQANEPYKHEAGAKPKNPKETYNQPTDNIASIALQPSPSSAYTAQTGDNSTGAVTGDGSNPPIEFPCMPPEVLGNAPFPPPGVSICKTTVITTLAAKLFSTGDVLTGDVIPDGEVNTKDLLHIARNLNHNPFLSTADINEDGGVDVRDLTIVAINFGKSAPPDPCIDVPAIGFVLNNDVIYSLAPAYTGDVKTIFDRNYCKSTGYSIDRLIADGILEIVVRDMPGRRDSEFVRRVKDNQIVGGTVYINRTNLNVGKMLERLAKDVYGGFHAFVFDRPLPADSLTSAPWAEGRGIIYETLFMQYLQEQYSLNMILADTEQNKFLLELYARQTLVKGDDPTTQGIRFAWAYAKQKWSADFNGPNAELNVAKLKEFKDFVNTISPMDFGPTYDPEWTSSVLVRRVSPDSDLLMLGHGLASMGHP